jgi:hypothetical protein
MMGDSYNGCSSALNAGLDAIFFLMKVRKLSNVKQINHLLELKNFFIR